MGEPAFSDDEELDADDSELLEGFEIESGLVDDVEPRDPATPPPPKARYYCTGADYKDEDGKKLCDHRGPKKWLPPCPKCSRWYDCKLLKSAERDDKMSRYQMTLADMGRVKPMEHHSTGIDEIDQVLGGGVVFGKVILFAGLRGGGKTRVWLQAIEKFATAKQRAAFFSGEDDRDSIVQFCQILKIPPSPHVMVYGNAQGLVVDQAIDRLRHQQVKLLVVDSAQAISHSASEADFRSQEQINKCCAFLQSFARQTKIAVVLIGQINEEGEISGGHALKHGVDVLVRFDPYSIVDENPKSKNYGKLIPGSENLRMLWIDGKSRQGGAGIKTYMEMDESAGGSLKPVSKRLLNRISKQL